MKEEILIAVVSSSAFSAVVTAIITAITARNKQSDSISAGVRILLYDRIKHLAKGYIHRGWITLEELEDLHSMHKIYHEDLDGNGFLDALMANAQALPIKEKE
ncbi:MAG: hypothetical protein IKE23_00875 [Exiguobacterium sp.]|nr:hypothetical protein [Exiguobacterium sp.]